MIGDEWYNRQNSRQNNISNAKDGSETVIPRNSSIGKPVNDKSESHRNGTDADSS